MHLEGNFGFYSLYLGRVFLLGSLTILNVDKKAIFSASLTLRASLKGRSH